jgi:septation ring formation regulator EzrA
MSAMANEPENLVLELLRGMRADITSVKANVELMRSQMVTKDELASEIRSLRADVASDLLAMQEKNNAEHKATREMVVGLRRAVIDYHSSVIGHGILISELDARMRRVEAHLNLPAMDVR